MVSLPHHLSNSPTPTRCPTVQFNSDSDCPQLASDSIGLRDKSRKADHISGDNCKCQAPRLPSLLSDLATKSGVSTPHPYTPFQNSGKCFYLLILVCYKGYNSRTTKWKRHTGQGRGGGASMPSPSAPPSQHHEVSTIPKPLHTWSFRVALCRYD